MANSDSPFGLQLAGVVGSSAFNAKIKRCYINASDGTALFKGDAVKLGGSADADGIEEVIQVAAGNTIYGVIVNFDPDPTNLELTYRTASTKRYCYVCIDPFAIYEIQEDGAIAATAIGNNADVVVSSGNTTTGNSGMELDSSSVGTATAQLRIINLVQREDNAIGTNGKYHVMINENRLTSVTGA